MPWLKLLHITAVIVWCGALLYLPTAIAATAGPAARAAPADAPPLRLLRTLFTLVATPAALAAIASGTAIFALERQIAPWLIFKLATVCLLVLGHGACGMLILRAERNRNVDLRGRCLALTVTSLVWLIGIAWLVLRKPF